MEETDVKDPNLKQSLESATSQISQLALSNSPTGKSSLNSIVGSDTANAGVDIDFLTFYVCTLMICMQVLPILQLFFCSRFS